MYISSNIISYLPYLICRACVVDSLHAVTVLSSRLVQGPAAKAVRQLREKNSEAQLGGGEFHPGAVHFVGKLGTSAAFGVDGPRMVDPSA